MGDGRSDHRRAAIRHSQTADCEGSVGRRSQLPNRGAVHLRQTARHPHVFSLPSMRLPRCTRTRVSRDGGASLALLAVYAGAIEYQANSTPHFHCNVYIASIWQQSLSELAAKLNDSTITFEDVQQFLTWAHPESHLDLASHTQQQDHLEADWAQNSCKASHDFLCQWPKFLAEDKAASPWLNAVEPKAGIGRRKSFHPPLPSSSTEQDQPSAASLASVERHAEVSVANRRLQKEGGAK